MGMRVCSRWAPLRRLPPRDTVLSTACHWSRVVELCSPRDTALLRFLSGHHWKTMGDGVRPHALLWEVLVAIRQHDGQGGVCGVCCSCRVD